MSLAVAAAAAVQQIVLICTIPSPCTVLRHLHYSYCTRKRGWSKKPQKPRLPHPENLSSLTGLQNPFEKKPSYYERAKARL